MAESMRRLEKKESEREEKKAETRTGKAEKPRTKKWKGKDWFSVLSPDMFNNSCIGDTPATDPKSLAGRIIEVGVPELIGDDSKYYMKMKFKIGGVSGKEAHTDFYGFSCVRDHISKMVRKRSSKIRLMNNIETKDNWKLQITSVAVLTRNADISVRKQIRTNIEDLIKSGASKASLEEFVKYIINNVMQKNIKRAGSKIYPIRFFEVERIEVLSAPK